MLRGLDPLLTADLLHALRAMGHGDTIAIVDANFPAVSTAQRLITLPGADADADRAGDEDEPTAAGGIRR